MQHFDILGDNYTMDTSEALNIFLTVAKKKKKDACSRTHNCYQRIPQNLHHFQQGPDKLTDKNPNLKNGQ